jgi:hypothetical protein
MTIFCVGADVDDELANMGDCSGEGGGVVGPGESDGSPTTGVDRQRGLFGSTFSRHQDEKDEDIDEADHDHLIAGTRGDSDEEGE